MNITESNKPAAVITGGGRGLGRVIAERLADDFNVLIIGRTEDDLRSTCTAIGEQGGVAEYIIGDVSKPDAAGLVSVKIQQLGWQVTAVVCNAGIGKSRPLHEIDNTEWQDVIDTNLNGCFYFSRAFLPQFVEQGSGVFCFISSTAGVKGYAFEAPYVASKHAVVGLAKTIALEYGKHGITSVALCPNFVEGDMTDRTISGLASRRNIPAGEARKVIEKLNPQRRIIPPEEVAELVSYVCLNKVPSLSNPIVMGAEA